MIVSVTGASGHIGSNVIPLLMESGYTVRALVREGAKHLPQDVETFHGDIREPDTLDPFINGADFVIHLAAKISIEIKEDPEINNINVIGTQNIINQCIKYQIKRLIHFSTIHSFDPHPQDEVLDETRGLTEGVTPYDRTKQAADQLVLDAVSNGLDAIILAPTSVFGPNDHAPSLMGQAIIDIYKNNIPSLVPGGYNFVDVRDIARGTVNALTSGNSGEKYILSGNQLEIKTLAQTVGRVGNVKVPTTVLPAWLLYLLLPVFRLQSTLQGKPPLLTRDSLDILLHGNPHISCRKAIEHLNYSITDVETSVSDTLDWLRNKNMI